VGAVIFGFLIIVGVVPMVISSGLTYLEIRKAWYLPLHTEFSKSPLGFHRIWRAKSRGISSRLITTINPTNPINSINLIK